MLLSHLRKTLDLDTEEAGSLLECQEQIQHEKGNPQQCQPHNPYIFLWQNARRYIHFVVLYTANFGLLIALMRAFTFKQSCSDPSQGFYSPAEEAVEYESTLYFDNGHDPYESFSYDKQDELWRSSYNFGMSVLIDTSSAAQLLNRTMKLPDPSDHYVIGLGAFHELHCLDQLRQSIYPNRYNKSYISLDGSKNEEMRIHLEHCINVLRFSIKCKGDITPLPYTWDRELGWSVQSFQTLHTCRNFEKLTDWAKERYIHWDMGTSPDKR